MNRSILTTMLLICGSCITLMLLTSGKSKNASLLNSNAAIESSVSKGFSLLQHSGAVMIAKVRCASCHHTTMTSMIAEKLTEKGITGLDTTAPMRTMAMVGTLMFVGNPNLNNQFVPAKFIPPYTLMGLAAEKYKPDFNTDIAVDYLIGQALPDGSFKAEYARVPFEMGDIHLAAISIRGIDLYASPAKRSLTKKLMQQTRLWLEKQKPTMQQEIVFQLLGMKWCGSDKKIITETANRLLAMQNKDGGWSQLPTMPSDAYATGEALYALGQSKEIPVEHDVVQKGIAYLLSTQDQTGAWIVQTRANPIQPFVNTDFPPYDDNQFISAAATNWAVLALVEALPDKK